jgi:hypothetical protein
MGAELPGFDAFSACLGDSFQLVGEEQTFTAELVEAKPLVEAPDRPFSLLFRVADGATLPQRIYPLKHDRLGRFELFLVPIGPDDVGMQYEAIFS